MQAFDISSRAVYQARNRKKATGARQHIVLRGAARAQIAARQSKTHVQRQSAIHLMVEELRAGLRPSSPKPPEAVA